MKRTLSIVLLFARPLHIWNIFFTLLALSIILRGGLIALPFSGLLKIIGYIGVAAYQNYMDSPAYNYFRNLGYQIRGLYLRVFAADLLLFLVFATIPLFILHGHTKG